MKSAALSNVKLFTERDENGKMTLRRGFAIDKGQHVLVVEDVVTTGGSVREVINLVKEAGGIVVGVGSIVDRTDGKLISAFRIRLYIRLMLFRGKLLIVRFAVKADYRLSSPAAER